MPSTDVAPAAAPAVGAVLGREQHLQAALEASHVWVQVAGLEDAELEHIEREVALLSPFVQREVLRSGHGVSEDDPVVLPKQVTAEVLQLLLTYCRYHRVPGHSDKERKAFDEKFIRLDTRRLCELTSAADSLEMKPLVDLTSRALARMIEGKTPEEIRATFKLPDDLTEEEKLEPLKSGLADARIKLLNKLYAKKRQSLAVKKAAIGKLPAAPATMPADDQRSLDQLLNFIQDGTAGSKGKGKKGKKKGRNRKAGDAEAMVEGSFSTAGLTAAGGNGYTGRGNGTGQRAGEGASASAPLPVLPADRTVPDADAAQPGHLYGIDDSDVASVLARRLQAEWRVPRAETVSVLTSLRDFRARMPNGGACSGSDVETSNSDSEYSDDASDAGSETDEEAVQDTATLSAATQRGAQQRQPAATNGTAPLEALQPDFEAAAARGDAGAEKPLPVGPTSSRPASSTSIKLEQPPPAANGSSSKAALLPSDVAGMPDPLPDADTPGGSECGPGSVAASDGASDSTAASTAAQAGSSKALSVAGMPDRDDFQALSSVLKQFLKAVDRLATVPGEVQTARLQLVRGLDGSLEAHTPSGASVELSWRFAQSHV